MNTTLETSIDIGGNNFKVAIHPEDKRVVVTHFVENYNIMPLLRVLLEDFKRPEEMAVMLQQLLYSDMDAYRLAEKPVDEEFQDRHYFIHCLIDGLRAGLH